MLTVIYLLFILIFFSIDLSKIEEKFVRSCVLFIEPCNSLINNKEAPHEFRTNTVLFARVAPFLCCTHQKNEKCGNSAVLHSCLSKCYGDFINCCTKARIYCPIWARVGKTGLQPVFKNR